MIKVFEGSTADEIWQKATLEILNDKNVQNQSGRGGTTRELLHVAFTLQDPRQRWIVTRHPALNPAFAIAEVIWILNGRRDSAFLNYWNPQLPRYAGDADEYHGAYGFRLRHHFGFDQLSCAYLSLRHNPDGRQVVLQIWDPVNDFPDENGRPVNADIPCNISSLLKIRNGKLEWTQIMRSNDLFRGVPYNFIQFTSLQEILAGWLDIELGSYNHFSDSLHLYDKDAEVIDIGFLDKVKRNTDSLCLPKQESDIVLVKVSQCIETMIAPSLLREELITLIAKLNIPATYKNLLYIVAAEAARKRGWIPLSLELGSKCSNPILLQTWERWSERFL